jgi:hypothetical protein
MRPRHMMMLACSRGGEDDRTTESKGENETGSDACFLSGRWRFGRLFPVKTHIRSPNLDKRKDCSYFSLLIYLF